MRVPVYMNPNVKCSEAGVNGGDGKFTIGGSTTSSSSCDFEEGQDSKASRK